MVRREEYIAVEQHLAQLLVSQGLSAATEPAAVAGAKGAFALLVRHLDGYYEARKGTADHCVVIGNASSQATVVYLRDHATKEDALCFAIFKAVIATLEEAARRKRASLQELASH